MIIKDFPLLWFPPLTYYRAGGMMDIDKMTEKLAKIYPYCRGVLIPGSTGDGWVLSQEKQEALVRFFLNGFPFGRFSVMIGALKPTAGETIAAINRWCEILCEVSGLSTPMEAMQALDVKAFVFCVPAGIQDRATQLREMGRILALGLPMAFYQLPVVTGVTVDAAVIAELAGKYDNLIIAKDSGGKDEMAKSGLLAKRLMLFRGAEGDPRDMLRGESPLYDGLLLATVNCFARELSELVESGGTYDGYGEVICKMFSAVDHPVSNTFSDAVRAICHAQEYRERAADIPCYCYNGDTLPADLIDTAFTCLRDIGQ
jgi:dihydrodipicolinate synthase/N-acetylneuraminate lyase